jgi:predicted TIM-barrel fold metal-dependent hydrolase
MIVDAWMQHPTDRFLTHRMFDSLRRWKPSPWGEAEQPLDATVAAMDDAGVDIGLLCAWHGPLGAMISNDEVAAACQAYPDRFFGIAAVDIYHPMEAVRELRRCVKQLGFKGLRLLPWVWGLPPDDRRFYPLYAECCELDVTFCTQVGHTGPLLESEWGRPIPYLDRVALEFPELRIVGGHIGVPWFGEMVSLMTKYENVFVDTSAYAVSRYPAEVVAFLKGRGRSRVLFGSNHPFWPAGDCLQGLEKLALDDEIRNLFLAENARRVFKL